MTALLVRSYTTPKPSLVQATDQDIAQQIFRLYLATKIAES